MTDLVGGPRVRVAPSRDFGPKPVELAKLVPETWRALRGPGDTLNALHGTRDYERLRSDEDRATAPAGLTRAGKKLAVADVPNPDSPDGKWDPFTFMPRFVFDAAEDALPVSPAFDGNADLGDNAPKTANGAGGHYQDGYVGGNQALSMNFAVTKKGPYTVLTYAMYLAHNKGGDYHANDYTTTQVYLAPGPDGKLAPAKLFASWHRGGVLSDYAELAKDAAGRPIVKVELGTHATRALGKGQTAPEDGLVLRGDGVALLGGKATGNRTLIDAFQSNVAGATRLVPGTAAYQAREKVALWGGGATDPYLPSTFAHQGFWHEVAQLAGAKARGVVAQAKGLIHKLLG